MCKNILEFSSENRMDDDALAIVISPNLVDCEYIFIYYSIMLIDYIRKFFISLLKQYINN